MAPLLENPTPLLCLESPCPMAFLACLWPFVPHSLQAGVLSFFQVLELAIFMLGLSLCIIIVCSVWSPPSPSLL